MSRISDGLSPASSGIDSITPFPLLEDEDDLDTPTAVQDEDDDALHMKSAPRRDRAGTAHSTIRRSSSSDLSSLLPKDVPNPDPSAEAKDDDASAGSLLSPSIEIQEAELQTQSQYYVENESLGDIEGESLDSAGEEFNDEEEDDDDQEVQDQSSDEEEDDEEDDGDEDNNNGFNMQRRFMQSSSSLSGPNAFAPPFYNRPPTPLPPSPSLTSLLRPPFSTTTSRPTTPDTSDAETPNDTEATVAKSARIATTVPRASPKVPTYEYYGFVLYLTSSCSFLMYLLWSYLPSPFLHQLGIYYYPNRWWSLAIPAWLVMTLVYIYVALACYNTGYLTLPMTSIENIVDEAANIAVIDGKGRRRPGGSEKMKPGSATSQAMPTGQNRRNHGHHVSSNSNGGGGGIVWKEVWAESTDAVMDIPVGGVCEILYGRDREADPALVESDLEEDDGQSHYSRYRRFQRQGTSHYDDTLGYRAAEYSPLATGPVRTW